MRWISTRTTRTPHLSVASSRIWRSAALTRSREVKASSRRHLADDVSQVGLGQLGDGQDEVGDVVEQALRVGRLEVDHGVDRYGHVVLRDDLLRWHVDDLLPHVDLPEGLDERHDDSEAGFDGLFVLAEALDDASLVRTDDLYAGGNIDESEDRNDDEEEKQGGCHDVGAPGLVTGAGLR